jgi:KDO2-lipid IV(A) lauroyltransferase
MKNIKYFIEAIFVFSCFLIIRILGLTISRTFFSCVFNKIGPYFKSNKITYSNLRRVFPKNSEAQNKEIVRKMWSNYGMTFVEYIFLNKFRNKNIKNTYTRIKGLEILDNLKKKNKPLIFVSGHFANFEMMSMELTKANVKLATIYRPLNNFFINPFMEYLRKKYICKNQIKKGVSGIRDAISFINKDCNIALMVDQRVSEGKKISFFNEEAYTTTLPSQLALKYNCEIVPIYISRNENHNFDMEILEPISITSKENSDKNKIQISLSINRVLEKMILRNPSQWIWTHNRWK